MNLLESTKALQAQLGVAADGIVGPATMRAIRAALDASPVARAASFDLEHELDELLKREGGFVDHPNDRGGPTRFGITRATALANGYRGDMRSLPLSLAKSIYRARYWSGPGFDQIAAMGYPLLAAELFDTGVNMGPTVQVRWLQRWLNQLCGQWPAFVAIGVDGQAGPGTRAAIQYLAGRRGQRQAEEALVDAVNCSQGHRYLELAEAREANQSFIWGWLTSRITL